MDEPFAALDVHYAEKKCRTVVQDLWVKTGATTLFVTHDVREAAVLEANRRSLPTARDGECGTDEQRASSKDIGES